MASLSDILDKIKKFLDDLKNKPIPVPTPNPTPTPDPSEGFTSDKVYGLMITDLICDTEIEKRKADLDKLRGSYNVILTVLDLQRDGKKDSRPYVDFARDKSNLTPLGVKNLKYIKALGWKVHLALLNSWGIKAGFSDQMASTLILDESNAYTPELLAQEKAFVTNLITEYGDLIDGIMPCLESQVDAGARFSYEIGKAARAAGFKGVISYNVPANSYDFKGIGALKARSQSDINNWTSSDNDIRNSDGASNITGNAANIKKVYTNPGPAGFYLWSADFIGGTGGRSGPISSIYLLGGTGEPQPSPAPTPSPTPAPTTFTATTDSVATQGAAVIEKAMKFWFPKIPYKEDSNASTSSQFMWKPISDSSGKLAIHTPAGENIVKVTVGSETASNSAIANGKRGTFRFGKRGGDYGNARVILHYASGTTKTFNGTGANRMDKSLSQISGLVTKKAGEPSPTPTPTPTPNDGFSSLFFTTPNSLTLRSDFAAAAGVVDALANNAHENGNANHIRIPAVRSGNTWTIPQPLSSYKRGSIPNTWRIRIVGKPPAGVTYHTSIMQSFVRDGDNPMGEGNKTYPPTIRA